MNAGRSEFSRNGLVRDALGLIETVQSLIGTREIVVSIEILGIYTVSLTCKFEGFFVLA